MDINKQIQNAIQTIVNRAIEIAPFNKTRTGTILAVNSNGTYKVLVDGVEYSNVPMKKNNIAEVGDIVKIIYPMNNASRMYIDGGYVNKTKSLTVDGVLDVTNKYKANNNPLFTYKTLTRTYTVAANSNTAVSWTASQGGLAGYKAVGIFRVNTQHETVCKISAYYINYDGSGAVYLSNHGNSSAISSSTLTVNILYVREELFA